MKKRLLQLSIVCATILTGCNKEKLNAPVSEQNLDKSADMGISVEDGRLKFASVENFNLLLSMEYSQQKEILKKIQNLEGFTSKKELLSAQAYSKPLSGCDCPIDDDYINSIIDVNNMLEIGDWTVKLDACNPQKKTYAFYNPMYSPADRTSRKNALINCNFNPSLNFFVFPYNLNVLEEIQIKTDSLNHMPYESRCKDVVCDDRHSTVYQAEYTGEWINSDPIPVSPVLRLDYHKGWLNHGDISVIMEYLDATPSNFGAWAFEFDLTYYFEKCGPSHTQSATTLFGLIKNYNQVGRQWYEVYSGGRLRAGAGNIKVRAKYNDPTHPFTSPWAEILF